MIVEVSSVLSTTEAYGLPNRCVLQVCIFFSVTVYILCVSSLCMYGAVCFE